MRSIVEHLFCTSTCVVSCLAIIAVRATPTVSDLKVTSVEPIGLAIDYAVSGAEAVDAKRPIEVSMTAVGDAYIAQNLSGATNCINGTHRVYWHMADDGLTLDVTNAVVKVRYKVYVPPTDGALFCVIDLSGGSSATSYPVTYLDAEPSDGFAATPYKTTKLVLKRVDAGSFMMQGEVTVTLTKPFYMGLFEVTQKQWELVQGTNVCSSTAYGRGDAYPVHYVSYFASRSFLNKLRAKTGNLLFDLPTETQWEYACRAGTTTTHSYDSSEDDDDYMWYIDNSSGSSHEVGTKKANPWGFYDMLGNVNEWCLDGYDASPFSTSIDPQRLVGSSSGAFRVLRGGSWIYSAYVGCNSSYRGYFGPGQTSYNVGFRVSRTLP